MRLGCTCALLLAGCSLAVNDLGDFVENEEACPPGGDPNVTRDFHLRLVDLGAHVNDLFVATVVHRSTAVLAARIIYDPLQVGTVDIRLDNALPPGEHFVDFYADLNGNRELDRPPADHTWSRDICDSGELTFVHVAQFEALDGAVPLGGDFTLTLNDIPVPLLPSSLEVRVVADFDSGAHQTVGLYRRTRVVEGRVLPLMPSETLVIPGILDGGTRHRIFVVFDVNRDRVADAGSGDVICLYEAVADPTAGISLTIDASDSRAREHCRLPTIPDPDDVDG